MPGTYPQNYGGYILPGSTLDDMGILVSQWNTGTNTPYVVEQSRSTQQMTVARVEGTRMLARILVGAITMTSAGLGSGACAHADAPIFPDINSYAPVNPGDYVITYDTPGIPVSGTYFLTPDGISCSIIAGGAAGCSGNNFPAVPPAAPTEGGTPRVNAISTSSPIHPGGDTTGTDGTIHDQPIKTLPPFHSIALGGVICGVDNAGTTACKDPQGRGFVLSPRGSGWLPHV